MEQHQISRDKVVPPEALCPLTTPQLVDVLMEFGVLYGTLHGIDIHSYQRLFMRRTFEQVITKTGNDITALWSRQSGKSEAVASIAPPLCILLVTLAKRWPLDPRLSAFAEGFWLGIFAPKQQQATIIYERIRSRAEKPITRDEIYADSDIGVGVASSRGDQVSWTNGSFVTAQTASEHSNVEGKTYHLIVIDEAQLVAKSKLNKEIRPMLTSTAGVLVQIGTANALRGNFKATIIGNIEAESRGEPRDHFEFPYDVIIRERRKTYEKTGNEKHLYYERWIAGELKRLGGNIENEEFRQNFRLLWKEANTGAIDPDALFDGARPHMPWVLSQYTGRIVAGLDYGKSRDVTVLYIMEVDPTPVLDLRAVVRPGEEQALYYNKHILAVYEIPGRKWHDILETVAAHCSRYAISVLVPDGTGVGDPLTESLQKLLPGVLIQPFVMSSVGNDRLYKLYIQEWEAGRISYPADEETVQTAEYQNMLREHEVLIKDKAGLFIKCYAPEGDHDDHPDAGALACFAATLDTDSVADVECGSNPFYGGRGDARGSSRADRYR